MTAWRIRRVVGVLALLGVLLHAAALVRHNSFALARLLSPQPTTSAADIALASLAAAGLTDGTICHVEGGDPAPSSGQQSPSHDCPICGGLVSAVALTPSVLPLLPVQHVRAVMARPEDRRATALRFARPQARGPPVRA